MTAHEVIQAYGLELLPHEGGYFRSTYLSHHSSAILYLLTPESSSALHRLTSDEMFHFYAGDAVEQLRLHPDGRTEVEILGVPGVGSVQVLVPAHCWQGARLVKGGRWALLGATCSPAFSWEGFELGARHALLEAFPAQHDRIVALTYGSTGAK